RPKIAGFGRCGPAEPVSSEFCVQEGSGTPQYLAPEQTQGAGGAVQPTVDVYALGVILYEMLTGRPPFEGASTAETIYLLQTQEPVPPRRLRPNVSAAIETICLKCLEKQPQRRYATAGALAEDLRHFQRGEPI